MEREMAMIIAALISNIDGTKEEKIEAGNNLADSILLFNELPSITENEQEEIKIVSKVLKKTYGGKNEKSIN